MPSIAHSRLICPRERTVTRGERKRDPYRDREGRVGGGGRVYLFIFSWPVRGHERQSIRFYLTPPLGSCRLGFLSRRRYRVVHSRSSRLFFSGFAYSRSSDFHGGGGENTQISIDSARIPNRVFRLSVSLAIRVNHRARGCCFPCVNLERRSVPPKRCLAIFASARTPRYVGGKKKKNEAAGKPKIFPVEISGFSGRSFFFCRARHIVLPEKCTISTRFVSLKSFRL